MECTKPKCECIAIAEHKNGGQAVKSFECLLGVKLSDIQKAPEMTLEEKINSLNL